MKLKVTRFVAEDFEVRIEQAQPDGVTEFFSRRGERITRRDVAVRTLTEPPPPEAPAVEPAPALPF